jgi:hypothetical protein
MGRNEADAVKSIRLKGKKCRLLELEVLKKGNRQFL